MQTRIAGGLTVLTGIMGILVHAGITLITALGSNLASTPETPVPELANSFWMISLYGTVAAVGALIALLVWWTKPLAIAYAAIWATLVGAYWTARVIDAGDRWLDTPAVLVLEAALPLLSVAFALYGVWSYRSTSR